MQSKQDQYDEQHEQERGVLPPAGLTARARIGLALGVLVAGYALLQLGGGFPPQAWKALFFLLARRGQETGGTGQAVIQSVVFLIAWLLLVLVAVQIVRPSRHRTELGDGEQEDATRNDLLLRETPAHTYPAQPSLARALPENEQGRERVHQTSQQEIGVPLHDAELFPAFPREEGVRSPINTVEDTQASEGHAREELGNPVNRMGLTTFIDPRRVDEGIERADRSIPSSTAFLPQPNLFTLSHEASQHDGTPSSFRLTPDAFLPPDIQTGMAFSGWSLCYKGQSVVKKELEDTLLVASGARGKGQLRTPFTFFILTDGIAISAGGTTGRLVSRALAEALLSVLWGNDPLTQEGIKNLLTLGVQRANTALYQQNQHLHTGKIATLCVVLVIGPVAYIANVGDNRAYFFRPNEGLVQVTFDHSSTEQQLEQGKITPAQVFNTPKERQVYRTLGQQATVNVDVFALALVSGDLLLMCTDGVWKVIGKTTLQRIVEHCVGPPMSDPSLLCPTVVRQALAGGGYDCASILAVQVQSHNAPSL